MKLLSKKLVKRRPKTSIGWACILALIAQTAAPVVFAGGIQTLDTVEVVARPDAGLVGVADTASQGTVTAKQLETRPVLRPAEILETMPGLIVTQHSGGGKANQYFLRGFNLDHGTDLALSLDEMPVNMVTHAHGQGYADLNFLIPELVKNVQYRKGPYYADQGDFSAAGSSNMQYASTLARRLSLTAGSSNYHRALVAGSSALGQGHWLYGFEAFHNDGPWDNPENLQKVNGVLRYSQGNAANGFNVMGMAYRANWDSTDQIPQRAVDAGQITRYGAVDNSDGGETHRYSLSGSWHQSNAGLSDAVSAFLIDYRLKLFSNFTYFLDDPVNGDQFEQYDRRVVSGLKASRSWQAQLAGSDIEQTLGLQARHDNIPQVALYHTRQRERLEITSSAHVVQSSASPYYQAAVQWTDTFRTIAGLRADFYRFNVEADRAANSGAVSDHIVSPKLSMIFGPWSKTEVYLNYGYGFHSNDARGTTITEDPKTGDPAERVTPLVRATGAELGVRTGVVPGLQSALSVWLLDIDSELLFVGDAGATEASRPSRRYGVEWANFYKPNRFFTLDVDASLSHSRFRDNDVAGKHIPGSIEHAVSLGIAWEQDAGWYAGARLRYFGGRPLIEDNSVRSSASTLVNTRLGYKFASKIQLALDVYNLFDRRLADIEYYYTSRLQGEGADGVDDRHMHPVERRALRVEASFPF